LLQDFVRRPGNVYSNTIPWIQNKSKDLNVVIRNNIQKCINYYNEYLILDKSNIKSKENFVRQYSNHFDNRKANNYRLDNNLKRGNNTQQLIRKNKSD